MDGRTGEFCLTRQNHATRSHPSRQSPYTLEISTGGFYIPTTRLETHSSLSDASYNWKVTQKQGTGMFFLVTDAQGQVGYVQNIYVQDSSDSSCLAGSSASSSSSSSSAAPSSTSSSAAPASTTQSEQQQSSTSAAGAAQTSSAQQPSSSAPAQSSR